MNEVAAGDMLRVRAFVVRAERRPLESEEDMEFVAPEGARERCLEGKLVSLSL